MALNVPAIADMGCDIALNNKIYYRYKDAGSPEKILAQRGFDKTKQIKLTVIRDYGRWFYDRKFLTVVETR